MVTRTRKRKLRPEEKLCVQCFHHYLVEKVEVRRVRWKVGEDPPDLYVTIEDREFAVEVTILDTILDTDSGRTMPTGDYEVSVKRLVQEIESEAKKLGILSGTYAIDLNGPFDDFKKIKRHIKRGALEYVRRTQNLPQAGYEVVAYEKQILHNNIIIWGSVHRVDVQKIGAEGARIHDARASYGRGRSWGGWPESDAALREACRLLQDALLKKKALLEKVNLPKILLLKHEYRLVNADVYQQCAGADGLLSFHSVFIVQNEREGYFLSTQEDAWRQQ